MSTKNKRARCSSCGKKERLRDRGLLRKPARFLCTACVDLAYKDSDFFDVADQMMGF